MLQSTRCWLVGHICLPCVAQIASICRLHYSTNNRQTWFSNTTSVSMLKSANISRSMFPHYTMVATHFALSIHVFSFCEGGFACKELFIMTYWLWKEASYLCKIHESLSTHGKYIYWSSCLAMDLEDTLSDLWCLPATTWKMLWLSHCYENDLGFWADIHKHYTNICSELSKFLQNCSRM